MYSNMEDALDPDDTKMHDRWRNWFHDEAKQVVAVVQPILAAASARQIASILTDHHMTDAAALVADMARQIEETGDTHD